MNDLMLIISMVLSAFSATLAIISVWLLRYKLQPYAIYVAVAALSCAMSGCVLGLIHLAIRKATFKPDIAFSARDIWVTNGGVVWITNKETGTLWLTDQEHLPLRIVVSNESGSTVYLSVPVENLKGGKEMVLTNRP